jgi:hypothetical protein
LIFPDLHARICKTFIEAISQKSSLSTIYGGIMGLGCLGISVIKTVLVPQLNIIHETLESKKNEIDLLKKEILAQEKGHSSHSSFDEEKSSGKRKADHLAKQKEHLLEYGLGITMCRRALKLVLGKRCLLWVSLKFHSFLSLHRILGQYITASTQLPSFQWNQKKSGPKVIE